MDISTRLARRVRELRDARGLSLDALAERSGVSRSNISLIERGESSPTATVLDKLATGLGVALASLFDAPQAEGDEGRAAPSPVARVAQQPVWTDPASGYLRRNVSPTVASPLQLVDVVFPPGQRVAYERADRGAEIHQQIWMIDGRMDIALDGTVWRLEAGDCLAHRLEGAVEYRNPTRSPARYLVALATLPAIPPHPTRSPT
ncbi:XRE family transcriptional regulator [Acidovorax sp. SUPP2522]|uniref:helix-turn-helix domain-containing protein n=1 Tax=unclassified Acidovorax TaxID=2684926 RepID=UPI00234B5619|nr:MULTISPECIES: XRE family transcriptional regulator [unclassified Acidovorax]WCM97733.1 XRE family transcriptional regulator [Acidovorax sp. GBBC 1281]GKT13354.1 XRE family transcriptional regulator [Acidovorax sp. SUPP2522]